MKFKKRFGQLKYLLFKYFPVVLDLTLKCVTLWFIIKIASMLLYIAVAIHAYVG